MRILRDISGKKKGEPQHIEYIDCQPYISPTEEEFLRSNGWTKAEYESLPEGLSRDEADTYIRSCRNQK